MARRLAENISTDHLSCPVCKEILNEPRLLPCEHTICTECLLQLITSSERRGRFLCPIDRKIYTKPTFDLSAEAWVQSFPLDDLAIRLIDTLYDNGVPCSNHDNVTCQFFCFTCLVMMCSECAVENHRNSTCDCKSISNSSDYANSKLHAMHEEMQRLEQYGTSIFTRETEKEQLLMQSKNVVEDSLTKLKRVVTNFETKVNLKIHSLYTDLNMQTTIHEVNHSAQPIIQALSKKQQEINASISRDSITDRLLLLTNCQAFFTEHNDRIYELLGIKEKPVSLKLELDQMFVNVCTTLTNIPPVGKLHVLPANSTNFEDSVLQIGAEQLKFATNSQPSEASQFQHSYTIELESRTKQDKPSRITDAVFNGNSIIIVDNANSKTKRFRVAYGNDFVDEIKILGVFGIANIQKSDDVMVTAPMGKPRLIRLSTYQGLRVEFEMYTSCPYYNITTLPDKWFAVLVHDKPDTAANKKVQFDWKYGARSHIDIIEEDGSLIKRLRESFLSEPEEFDQPSIMPLKSICGLPNHNLVLITESKADDVIRCIDVDGGVKWTYRVNDKPQGICCSQNSLYVYFSETKVVRVFTFDGDLRPTSTIKLDEYKGDGNDLVLSQTLNLLGVIDRTTIMRLFDFK